MNELVKIREAEKTDLPTITAYANAEGMGEVVADDTVFVAVNDGDEVVGFIRLVFDAAGICHVNPIVVHETWRGFGVGRLLIEYVQNLYGELQLVSRGSSLAFYDALGFEPIAWESIFGPIAEECDGCEMFEECNPVPVAKK